MINNKQKGDKAQRKRRGNRTLFSTDIKEPIKGLSDFLTKMGYKNNAIGAYSTLLSTLRRRKAPIKTMGVTLTSTGGYELLYDPVFDELVKDSKNWHTVRMILLHECAHIQLGHVPRGIAIYLREEDKEIFKKINPYSVDFSCNSSCIDWGLYSEAQLLSGEPYVLEEDNKTPKRDNKGRIIGQWRGVLPTEEPFNLQRGLSYEEYYSLLKGILKGEPPKGWGDLNPSDKEEKLKKAQDALNSSSKDGDKKFLHIEDFDIEEMSEEELEELEEQTKKATEKMAQELLTQLKSKGLGSSDLAQSLEIPTESSKLHWKKVLESMVRKASLHGPNVKTYSKTNKRKAGVEGIEVSLHPAIKRERRVKALVAIDTSASFSNEAFVEMLKEIRTLKRNHLDQVTILYCTTEIVHVEELSKSSKVPSTRHGFGGTDFNPVFTWANKSGYKPDILIYGTDGECSLPDKKNRLDIGKTPVLWVISRDGCMPGSAYGEGRNMVPGKAYTISYNSTTKDIAVKI